MILYLKHPKDSNKNLLDLKSTLGKIAEYKLNTQKSVACLYIKNEQTVKKLTKMSHSA
jgi:hypothetical protein